MSTTIGFLLNFLNVQCFCQPAALKIVAKGTLLEKAAVVDAALVLCGLKIFTFIPDLCKMFLVHLHIVSLLTALYGLCVVRKSFVITGLPSVLILKVLCKKYFKVSKIHKSFISDGNAEKFNSAKCFPCLEVFYKSPKIIFTFPASIKIFFT